MSGSVSEQTALIENFADGDVMLPRAPSVA
jgi:hypothetical protein